jgi:hypothetical protein
MVGGIGALAASVIGGASRVEAAAGSALIIGSSTNNAGTSNTTLTTNSSVVAFQLLQKGGGTSLMGYVTPATGPTRGVYGRTNSSSGDGVQARNAGAAGTGAAVRAFGGNNHGVIATSDTTFAIRAVSAASNAPAIRGIGSGTQGSGVSGHSTNWVGVGGTSTNGFAIWGESTNNYAGFFVNHVYMGSWIDIQEISEPAAAGPNQARLFTKDNGVGKTQLCVRFPSGATQVLATEA